MSAERWTALSLQIESTEKNMTRQIIVVGDTLAPYGGEVLTGSDADIVEGKTIARRFDFVRCAEHGMNRIEEGDATFVIDGQPAALERHRATCGCTLISRRATVSVS
ncbi:PAAR domain-containing protein [Burkholderia cenocepacia]|uniref:PAAR domain-containing protein n=1 Tax=Burkholderia cenocepacia TaxID=95486 RepID=UPI002AB6CD7D|nr:PAAR domain-containing protein [Burkholderia cenocepacia]